MIKTKVALIMLAVGLSAGMASAGTGQKPDGDYHSTGAVTYKTNSAGEIVGCEREDSTRQKCTDCRYIRIGCNCTNGLLLNISTNYAAWLAQTNISTNVVCYEVKLESGIWTTNIVSAGAQATYCTTNIHIDSTGGNCGEFH